MTLEIIKKKLKERYNYTGKEEQGKDVMEALSRYKPDDLNKIWIKFDAEYLGMGAPKPANFHSIAIGLGLIGQSDSGQTNAAWICANKECNTRYAPLTAYMCPECGETKTEGLGDQAHPLYRFVDEDAKWYKDKLKAMAEERIKTSAVFDYKDLRTKFQQDIENPPLC
ncbi:MAG: hypothetical protein DRI69_09070 [Bacteroidetes bacterium]|nr:MAG: hypothetical protein DRI69_09070 [Bacteroidota bacterium]